MGPRCSSAETQVCHRSYIIAARGRHTFFITVKELFPIVLAVEIWGQTLSNHKVLFMTDNQAVSEIINKTSSKEKKMMKLVPDTQF
jgi:hypothetical protein